MKSIPIIRFRVLAKKCGHLLDNRLSPHGLNTTKARVLAALANHTELTPTDLLPWASVEPASMSLLLQAMEREGWIERKPHPSDKRAILLTLTEQGVAAHRQALGVLEQTNEDLFGILDAKESEELQRVLHLLSDRLGELGIGCSKNREVKKEE